MMSMISSMLLETGNFEEDTSRDSTRSMRGVNNLDVQVISNVV